MPQEWLRDHKVLRDVLRRRLLRAMVSAAGTLADAARGRSFRNDEQRYACNILARLAPALVGVNHDPPEQPLRRLAHPMHTEEEAFVLLEELKALDHTREQCADLWAQDFRKGGRDPGRYNTLEEAMEYGRSVWDRVC